MPGTTARRPVFIDIAVRTSSTFEAGQVPYAFAMAPDGSVVLAALSGAHSVVVM
jgi:hypothetical protein